MPTKKINVKAMCACGEEVIDKEYDQLMQDMIEFYAGCEGKGGNRKLVACCPTRW
jgi:hypothetical protein